MSRFATQVYPAQSVQNTLGARPAPVTRFPSDNFITTWSRPNDWLTLPVLSAGENKFVALFPIYNSQHNRIAMSIGVSPAGTYTVNWGDGTSSAYSNNTTATKEYDYSSLSASVTSGSYKQVIITVAPTASTASLTTLNFNVRPVLSTGEIKGGSNTPVDVPVQEFAVAGASISSFAITGSGTYYVRFASLESCSFIGPFYYLTDGNYLFWEARSLKNVYMPETASIRNAANMFSSCYSLENAPFLNTACVTNAFSMFNNCNSLKYVPDYNLTNCTNTSQMFYANYSLMNAPAITTSSVLTSASYMFFDCRNLISVPLFNTACVSDFSYMFYQCQNLKSVPNFNTSRGTTFAAMFLSCVNLEQPPNLITSNAINFDSMHTNNYGLKQIPLYNTACAQNVNNMFNTCFSVEFIPQLDLTSCSLLTGLFANMYNVKTAIMPKISTRARSLATMFQQNYNLSNLIYDNSASSTYASVTNFSSMFSTCYRLESAPMMDTACATNMTSMFNTCYSLKSVPLYNTINVTNMGAMFNNCRSLEQLPNFNTPKVQSFNLFAAVTEMVSIMPLYDTSAAQDIGSMYSGRSYRNLPDFSLKSNTTTTQPNNSTTSLQQIDFTPFFDFDISNTNVSSSVMNLLIDRLPDFMGKNVASAYHTAGSGSTTFVTSGPHKFLLWQTITATGITPSAYNISGRINSIINASTFTIASTTASGAFVSGGQVRGTPRALSITSALGAYNNVPSGNMSLNSNVYVLGSGSPNYPVGSYVLIGGTQFSPTIVASTTAATNLFRFPLHGIQNNFDIYFTSIATTTGISTMTKYYVINTTASTFQISVEPGGAPVTLTNDGTATLVRRIEVLSSIGSSVTISAYASAAWSGNLTIGPTKRQIAIQKGWTVTG